MGKGRGRVWRAALMVGLLGWGWPSEGQRQVSIYGGQFVTGDTVRAEVYGVPTGTRLRLEQVTNPERLLAAQNPRNLRLTSQVQTRLLREVSLRGSGAELGRLPSGVYLLRRGEAAGLIVVTRLGLVTKRDSGQALVYAADRRSGQIREALVWSSGQGQAPRRTDARGVSKFMGRLSGDQTFVARSGPDWAVSGSNWNDYLPRWLGQVYTDRPIYRPGHTVEFKGLIRKPGSLEPLRDTRLTLTVTAPNGETVLRRALTSNAFGSVTTRLELGVGAALGNYQVALAPAGQPARTDVTGSFAVQEYQKPEYAVTLTPERRVAVQGETVRIKVAGRYLFGGALSGAKLSYSVTRAPYYPPGFDQAALPPGEDEGSDYGADLVVQAVGRLNSTGELELKLPLGRDPEGRALSYRVEVRAEDESRNEVSARTQVIAYPAAVNVEAQTDRYAYAAGNPLKVTVQTRDLQGRGRPAPVSAELVRWDWVKRGGRWTETREVVARRSVQTGANGAGSLSFTPRRAGGYLLRTRVTDAQGRRSQNETFAWVTAPGETFGWYSRDLQLSLDRPRYAPGDTATVLVTNPYPGSPVLLTLEGERLRLATVLRGAGGVLSYRFKVTADMAPNIFAGASVLGDGEMLFGNAEVKVPRTGSALKVQVTPDRARYRPGERGTLQVQVRDSAGRGVPAEVALGVVDEAIYLVQRDTAPALLNVFTATRGNAVGTQTSADFYFSPLGPQGTAGPRSPMDRAAFAQSKAEAPGQQSSEDPRSDFRDTLLWIPKLTTDAQGRARVEVRYPDNLTTWVSTARAQTQAPRFGEAQARTLVTKDVIARLSLPPFLVRGDRANLGGLVNNTLGRPLSGQTTLTLSSLSALGALGAPLNLPAQGRSRRDLPVQADQVGSARVTFRAQSTLGGDALTLPLPVKARGYAETRLAVGSAERPSVTLTLPPGTNPQTVRLSVSAAPSLLGAVAPALEYLLDYPYGCTEQTMSRFLPALLAQQSLGLKTPRIAEYTALGLARLAAFQHSDGGWGFWEFDSSTLEMTAYVTEGLLRAKGAGSAVNPQMLSRALDYLSREARRGAARPPERARAYRALAQAGRVSPELLAFSARGDLNAYALAQTALALSYAGRKSDAAALITRLEAKVKRAGGLNYWDGSRSGLWLNYWDENSVQVTAAALEALGRLKPGSPLIAPASQWMLAQRRGPRWVSTQDTTSAVIAALALPRPREQAPARLGVEVGGRRVGEVRIGGEGAGGSGELKLSPALGPGTHTLTLRGAPAGLSFSAQASYVREAPSLGGNGQSFELGRRYDKLVPEWDAKGQRYTYRREPLRRAGQNQTLKVGDLVLVTLHVKPRGQAARYLLVSDPVPAGMRALDDRSLRISGLKTGDEYDYGAWNYWYGGRELRDDRVDLYANFLKGAGQMTYVLRAQTPGTFTALPTHAFLMYDPSVESYGAAATLKIEGGPLR